MQRVRATDHRTSDQPLNPHRTHSNVQQVVELGQEYKQAYIQENKDKQNTVFEHESY